MSSDPQAKPNTGYPAVMPLSITAVWDVFNAQVIKKVGELPGPRSPGFTETFHEQIFYAGAKSVLSILIRGAKLGADVEGGAELVQRLMNEINDAEAAIIAKAAAAILRAQTGRWDSNGGSHD
jgi:hypothetical protein